MPLRIDDLGVKNYTNAKRINIKPNPTGDSTLERTPEQDEFTLRQNKYTREAIGLAAGLFALGALFGTAVQAKADGVEPDYTIYTKSLKIGPLMEKGDDYLHSQYEDAIDELIDESEDDEESEEYPNEVQIGPVDEDAHFVPFE